MRKVCLFAYTCVCVCMYVHVCIMSKCHKSQTTQDSARTSRRASPAGDWAAAQCGTISALPIAQAEMSMHQTALSNAARSLSCACALCLEFALMLIFKHKHAPNSTIQCRAARSLSLSCVCWLGLEFGLMLIVLHTLSLRTHYEKNIKMADGAGWCTVMGAECGPGCCGNCAHGQGGTDLPRI